MYIIFSQGNDHFYVNEVRAIICYSHNFHMTDKPVGSVLAKCAVAIAQLLAL